MSEELKAFEKIKKMYEHFVTNYRGLEPKLMICEKEDFATIETALKNYDLVIPQIEKLCKLTKTNDIDEMVCNVETALKRLKKLGIMHSNALKKIEKDRKKLKALEIIKEEIKIDLFYDDKNNECWIKTPHYMRTISKDRYDLLKEVLL